MEFPFRIVLRVLVLCSFIIICLSDNTFSQVYEHIYRPSQPAWQQLETTRFNIIYRKGEEKAALRTAHILEEQYPHVRSLTGGSLTDFPVVLNSHNDLSNGLVSTLHFRMEVEIPRIKGKQMNPADGNWLQTVMPHELVHALHLNVLPWNGISGLVNIFSPDVARSMHFAAPLGMIEGIAVFHESHHHYGIGGRGNHSYFNRRHDAIFDSRNRWSLAQSLTSPAHTFPFDRHYVGGHAFIHWLQYEYGMDITKNTIRFVSRWPFLGYGSALWYHTGKRPSQLQAQFESDQEKKSQRIEATMEDTVFHVFPETETMQSRRPVWLSDSNILFYSADYDKRPGFYSYDTRLQQVSRINETGSVDDYSIALHPDRSRIMYARYHRHPYYHNHNRMRIHELRFEQDTSQNDTTRTGTSKKNHSHQPVETDRLYAPSYGPDGTLWALQTHHENNLLVRFNSPDPDTVLIPEDGHLISLGFHPSQSDSLFLIGNRNGMQGLWLLQKDQLQEYHNRAPDIAFENGAIYDATWHPDGNKLLFSSDVDGALNLYEYETDKDVLWQLTQHPYGIMEGSYSPDANTLAAIKIHENTHQLTKIRREDLSPTRVPENRWKNAPITGPSSPPSIRIDQIPDTWTVSDYHTGIGWIRPRVVFPYVNESSQFRDVRFGVVMASGDVMRRNSYFADISTSNNRFWYDLQYQHSGFYPGFRINAYHKPEETTNWLQRSQGIGMDIPIPILFDRDTRSSSLVMVPGIDLQRQQVISQGGDGLGPEFDRFRGTFDIVYRHRLQQKIRDVQPNTGWLLYTNTEWDFFTDFEGDNLKAMRAGIYRYISTRYSGNRSLRVGIEGLTQNRPYFDISGFYSRGFDENILMDVNNSARLHTRYTIPLWHADRGWILLPFFMDRIYAVLFTETLAPLHGQATANTLYRDSRSLYGAGLRLQMRIFNFPVDIGVATVYEPTRERVDYFIGSF